MDPMILILILGVVVALISGGLIGFLIGNARAKDRKEESAASIPPPKPVDAGMTPPAALTDRKREDYHPVVCLWRNRSTGELSTEIKGKLYTDLSPLSVEVRNKLQEIAREWSAWVGIKNSDIVSDLRMEYPVEQASGAVKEPYPAEAETIAPQPRPNLSVSRMEEKPAERVHAAKTTSIAEQIDEILQEMLQRSQTENRAIRLLEEPGGVSVWVGLTRYNSIDEVEDPSALKMIKAAVAEWERRTGESR